MPELAQTNVQLIRQLVHAGWDDADLQRLRTAYELDMWAYSGQFRGNGKTQIAHHVGVASALSLTGARPTLVLAGLVHSLYFLGEFGTGRRGPHPDKRARVRADLGTEIDEILYEYTEAEWCAAAVARMTADAAGASPIERDVVALRVANEVDEAADLGMGLSGDHHPHDLCGDAGIDRIVALADVYGLGALGALLREQWDRARAVPVPQVLVSPEVHTVFVPPASFRRRIHIALQDSRVGHRLAERVPGARRVGAWVRENLA